jgi:hypothetical protein
MKIRFEKEDPIKELDKKITQLQELKENAKTAKIKVQESKEKEQDAKELQKKLKKQKKEESPPEILSHPHYHNLNQRPERLKEYSIWQSGSRIKRFFRKRKYGLNSDRAILINMELNIGDHISFIAYEQDGGFVYKKKRYLFDYQTMYYNMSHKLWCYDYHENFCLPIKRQVPTRELRGEIAENAGDDMTEGYAQVEYLTNPKTLYEYSIAKLAEGILRGAALEQWLKRIFFISIIAALAGVIAIIVLFVKFRGIEKILSGGNLG